jgi:class 3 adenylate cyclase
MALADDLKAEVATIFGSNWTTRAGQVVPEPADLKLLNDAVEFERATVLYADLTGSTNLVDTKGWMFAAEVYKSYLHCAGKLIRAEGGAITSYDGDRVMAVFIGNSQTTSAVRCGLKLNYVVQNIINPALKAQYPANPYMVSQVVGIDTSTVRAARTGVRGNNDIVWVGRAANHAAKLTEIKQSERLWVTADAHAQTHSDLKKPDMWKLYNWTPMANAQIYGTTWWSSVT